jgi:hypothetical protein
MKRHFIALSVFLTVALSSALTLTAAIEEHTAADLVGEGVAISPAFGPLAAGGEVGTAGIPWGVDYSYGGIEGIFNDPPEAAGGISGSGYLDLLSPVDARIVLLSTTTPGLTSYIWAEAGFAADGTLKLEAFDINGDLLDSALNGPPAGPAGRTTFEIDRSGVYDIAYFKISGEDTFGVNTVRIQTPIEAGDHVPDSSQMIIPLAGIFLIGLRRLWKQ